VAIVALALSPAAEPGSWLEIVQCPELDADSLRAHTLVELGGLDPEGDATVRCEEDVFVVRVQNVKGAISTRKLSQIGEVPERYLALELAELIASARYAPAASAPAATPLRNPPPVAAPRAPAPARRGWTALSARVELTGKPTLLTGGGSLALGGRVWRYLSLRARLTGLGGGRSLGEDRVRVGALWGSAAALASVDAGPVAVHAGAGARVGGVWMRGVPRESGLAGLQHGGLTWGPFGAVGVLAPLGRRLAFVADLDVGYTLRAVRGTQGGALVLSYAGVWAGLTLGLGVMFGR